MSLTSSKAHNTIGTTPYCSHIHYIRNTKSLYKNFAMHIVQLMTPKKASKTFLANPCIYYIGNLCLAILTPKSWMIITHLKSYY